MGPTGSLEPPMAAKTRSRRTRGRDLAAQLGAFHGEEDDGEGGGGSRSRGSHDQSSKGGDGRNRGGNKSLAILASWPSQSFKVLICHLKSCPHFCLFQAKSSIACWCARLDKSPQIHLINPQSNMSVYGILDISHIQQAVWHDKKRILQIVSITHSMLSIVVLFIVVLKLTTVLMFIMYPFLLK